MCRAFIGFLYESIISANNPMERRGLPRLRNQLFSTAPWRQATSHLSALAELNWPRRSVGMLWSGAARPSASRRSASGHAFVIVSSIARCSLPLLARILRASRSSAEPSRLVARPPASVTISAPAAMSHGQGQPARTRRNRGPARRNRVPHPLRAHHEGLPEGQ